MRQVRLHQLDDLSNPETKNEVLLDTTTHTELHIYRGENGRTFIKFPFGNKFDIVDNVIIIHEV